MSSSASRCRWRSRASSRCCSIPARRGAIPRRTTRRRTSSRRCSATTSPSSRPTTTSSPAARASRSVVRAAGAPLKSHARCATRWNGGGAMHRPLTILGAALVLLAVVGGSAGASANATPTGTAVVALDFEPPCLNVVLAGCNVASAHWTAGLALAGAYRVRPDSTYEPVLVERVDVEREPFALTFHIRPDAVWSDGAPVGADDFLFTLETILDPQNSVSRTGYELVTQAAKLGPKTVRLQFSRGYAHWR